MMLISVVRDISTQQCTQSEVLLDGAPFGYGLEPPLDFLDMPSAAIPAGKYEVWLRWSETHSMWVPAVEGVPGRTNIEIHTGNWPKDTRGCLLIGEQRCEGAVTGSRGAFNSLMQAIIAVLPMSPIRIQYINRLPLASAAKGGTA